MHSAVVWLFVQGWQLKFYHFKQSKKSRCQVQPLLWCTFCHFLNLMTLSVLLFTHKSTLQSAALLADWQIAVVQYETQQKDFAYLALFGWVVETTVFTSHLHLGLIWGLIINYHDIQVWGGPCGMCPASLMGGWCSSGQVARLYRCTFGFAASWNTGDCCVVMCWNQCTLSIYLRALIPKSSNRATVVLLRAEVCAPQWSMDVTEAMQTQSSVLLMIAQCHRRGPHEGNRHG